LIDDEMSAPGAESVANGNYGGRTGTKDAFRHPIRVYYEDTDAAGVVYYANYLCFMERGRTEWLRALGHPVEKLACNPGCSFVVRKAYVDYIGPARLGDELSVSVSPDCGEDGQTPAVQGAVINLRQTVSLGEEILVSADIQLACVNTASLRPTRVPRAVVQSLGRFNSGS